MARVIISKKSDDTRDVLVKKTRPGENPTRATLDVPIADVPSVVAALLAEVRGETG